ncbi:hypothetical protein F2Q69_00025493 [Brassica cretica]|uniref:Uncharacterized protein n=1 Tax=Brassica cretica TaxID=69181 RepID=A0A8S9QFJ4_BRACR|nr:hypothetical protein F2Q69_00025493 [Brassica cretica]
MIRSEHSGRRVWFGSSPFRSGSFGSKSLGSDRAGAIVLSCRRRPHFLYRFQAHLNGMESRGTTLSGGAIVLLLCFMLGPVFYWFKLVRCYTSTIASNVSFGYSFEQVGFEDEMPWNWSTKTSMLV